MKSMISNALSMRLATNTQLPIFRRLERIEHQ